MTDKPKDIKVLWKEEVRGMSLGEKWLRICLPMQGTYV